MKMLSIITRVGLLGLALVLITTITSDLMWESEAVGSPTTQDLAAGLLIDWSFALVILGALLALAMVGAAYLARDERMENQLYEIRGEEE
jgi:NADH:ubiquinone oxidoreductase subunit 6 (subunit J)